MVLIKFEIQIEINSIFVSRPNRLSSCSPKAAKVATQMVELRHPIIPGYFADLSLVQYDGKFYMYVTADPWGTDFIVLVGKLLMKTKILC